METREIITLVRKLIKDGIFLYVEGDDLKYRSKKGNFSDLDKKRVQKNKEAIKSYLLNIDNRDSKPVLKPIELVKVNSNDSDIPLSYAQHRLWFEDKLQKGNTQYNTQGVLFFEAPFDKAAFAKAYHAMLERHHVLRTCFKEEEGKPRQHIVKQYEPVIKEYDIANLEQHELNSRLQNIMQSDEKIPFDLEKELMIRMNLVKIPNKNFVAFYTLHHIAGDGWSVSIFKNEFNILYRAFAKGLESPLAPLEFQYADYSAWQKDWLAGDNLKSSLEFWKSYLLDIPIKHNLPLDYIRPNRKTFDGQFFTQQLPKDLISRIRQICKQQDVTLFMFLQTAFAVLLSRISNESDIVFGAAVAGREHRNLEEMIGLFLNILVMRTDLTTNPTFQELLQTNKVNVLNAFENQMVPFDMIVEELNPERDLSFNPIVQILFGVQNNEGSQLESMQQQDTSQSDDSRLSGKMSTRFDLKLDVYENSEAFSFTWLFNIALFAEDSVRRFANTFKVLLESITESYQNETVSVLKVGELNIISNEELALLNDWNRSSESCELTDCFHQLFEEQVNDKPDAIAVIYDNQEFTYQTINERANQLAHYLEEVGVNPGVVVGLNIQRSTEMLISLLAILKVGAIYLPLDPVYPRERLAYMLKDSNAKFLLTTKSQKIKFDQNQIPTICVDEKKLTARFLELSKNNLIKEYSFYSHHQIAYIIYTSGSTGKPKGVAVNHQSLVEFLKTAVSEFMLPHIDGAIVSSPLVFDATIGSLLVPLICGKFVELLPEEDLVLDHLADCLCDDENNYLFKLTPSHLEAMMSKGYIKKNENAHHVIVVAGEALSKETIQLWHSEFLPSSLFINEYGPTETTVGATIYPLDESKYRTIKTNIVPIGEKLGDTQLYVLNQSYVRQSIGCIGELYIAGKGVATGYYKKPVLTAERFIPNPFTSEKGSRLYKTGDLVRFNSQGLLEFYGRIDHQIKIRGFRIELSEIESCLLNLHNVVDAAVKIFNPHSSKAQIIAYVVSKVSDEHSEKELIDKYKTQLQQSLPSYMIPAGFVIMDKLPLTTNGKLDVEALPLHSEYGISKNYYIKPRNNFESSLSQIWSDLLDVEQIGINDNFFDLGGHSLLATRLVSAIRTKHQIEVPLKNVFENPVLADFANSLTQKRDLNNLPDIEPQDRSKKIELSYAQRRLWFIDQLDSFKTEYNVAGYFPLVDEFNKAIFRNVLNTIVQRHEVLRTNYVSSGKNVYQKINKKPDITIECQDFSGLKDKEKLHSFKSYYQKMSLVEFQLESDLLIKVSNVKLSENENIVVYVVHHIACDGWSIKILENEFNELYSAFIAGLASPLMPLPIQYADYSMWQHRCFEAKSLSRQLNYWKCALKNIPQLHSLPIDRERKVNAPTKGMVFHKAIDSKNTLGINKFCNRHQVTQFMFFYTVFSLLLSRVSLESDVVVGTPVSGRNHSKLEDLIGFFVNTLVLRNQLDLNVSFTQCLNESKEIVLQAFNNQDIPFDMLVEELNPQRTLTHNPLVQVQFSFESKVKNSKINHLSFDKNQSNKSFEEILSIGSKSQVFNNVKDELYLNVKEVNSSIVLSWVYDGNLFSDATITNLAHCYEVLIDSVIANPHLKLYQFDLMSEQKRRLLFKEYKTLNSKIGLPNKTNERVNDFFCYFDQVASESPNKLAIEMNSVQITYGGLNQRVLEIASYLAVLNINYEQPVAVCVERGSDLIAAVFAILKLGAAYVPIDPKLPKAKISEILQCSNSQYVFTQTISSKELVDFPIPTLPLDSIKRRNKPLELEKIKLVSDKIHPEFLAYVMFTSGSSGQAKGVQVTRKALLNYISHCKDEYFNQSIDGSCVASSVSFDATITSLLAPLFCGKFVKLTSEENELEELTAAIFNDQQNLLFKLTPTHLKTIRINAEPKAGKQRHYFIVGGEQFNTRLLTKWKQEVLPNSIFINEYGPTETCVGVSTNVITKNTQTNESRSAVSIGSSIENVELFLCDPEQKLVPLGFPGEVVISGNSVARGYLGQPAATAKKFIPNVFSEIGDRLYRSGDLARYIINDNGIPISLEYIGRIDEQVKIHGARVELNEIERAVSNSEAVKNCVVTTFLNEHNIAQLVAYIQLDNPSREKERNGEQSIIAKIKTDLRDYLPDYLIPQYYQFVDNFELTTNGKLDRKKLPKFETTTNIYIAPTNEHQRELCSIWQELLEQERISIEDNFFKLGGHSLLAAKLVGEINHKFKLSVTIRQIFESPTVAELSDIIKSSETLNSKSVNIKRISREDKLKGVPLSYSQQRLWFIDQLELGSVQYNITEGILFEENICLKRLTKALNTVVEHHDILKTVYSYRDGSPIQLLLPKVNLNIKKYDYSGLETLQKVNEVKRLYIKDKNKPFNLETDLQFRTSLVKLSENRYLLLYTLHHIACDAWSLKLIKQSIIESYQKPELTSNTYGEEKDLKYSDYAVWQREWLNSHQIKDGLAYWKAQLNELPQTHNLNLDRIRPKNRQYKGRYVRSVIESEQAALIESFCQEQEVTLFMFLHAVLSQLILQCSEGSTVAIGSSISGREVKALNNVVGFFINDIVIKHSINNKESFLEHLNRCKRTILDAFTFQYIPFDMLVEEVNPNRNLNYNPLFQIKLDVSSKEKEEETSSFSKDLEGFHEISEQLEHFVKHDIYVDVQKNDKGLEILWRYDTAIFDFETIHNYSDMFKNLVLETCKQPKQVIRDINLLGEKQKKSVLEISKSNYLTNVEPMCIHRIFEESVTNRSDEIALHHQSRYLSFYELNIRSNKLARYLVKVGATKDSIIPLFFNRSIEMIISMLAILKSGASYLPIDPDYQDKRAKKLLESQKFNCVLTHSAQFNRLGRIINGEKLPIINVDSAEVEYSVKQESGDNLTDVESSINDLAYIIYTSGSSGEPKGVMVEHQALSSFLNAIHQHYYTKTRQGTFLATSYAFDLTIPSIFLPLLYGGTIRLFDQGLEIEQLANTLNNNCNRVDESQVIRLTPSHLAAIIPLLENKTFKSAYSFVIGGEAFPTHTARQLKKTFPNAKIFNQYGPAETTVACSLYRVDNNLDSIDSIYCPIGQSIADAHLYVLNTSRKLCPLGTTGELYVGGRGLSRGYFNNPQETKQRFLNNPFLENSPNKMYKTGDLVRWRKDGNLEFLSRVDNQVKLNGIRVDLSEIENSLRESEYVRDCIVIKSKQSSANNQLVAYIVVENIYSTIVLKDNAKFSRVLNSFLATQLSQYMTPKYYVYLESLPLTVNGKINFESLPNVNEGNLIRSAFVDPTNETETRLCEIWQELLRKEKVGINDSFFALGGHSLIAVRLLNKIKAEFNCQLPLRAIFESPTIAELALLLENYSQVYKLPEIEKVDRNKKIPLSFSQRRLWFVDQLGGGSSQYNMKGKLKLDSEFDREYFEKTIKTLLLRHEILRTKYIQHSDGIYQELFEAYSLPVFYYDISEMASTEQKNRINDISTGVVNKKFDLTHELPIRFIAIKSSVNDYLVFYVLHHIAADGWSSDILQKDFTSIYSNHQSQNEIKLPSLEVQYADYANWQINSVPDSFYEAQLGYWKEKLKEIPVVHGLPLDRPRPPIQNYRGRLFRQILSKEINEQISQYCDQKEVTLFMFMQTLFALLIGRYSDSSDIVMGTAVAGRNQPELENVIGLFLNILVLRTDLSKNETFESLIDLNKSMILEAFANQDLPFDRLVEELSPQRNLRHNSLVQILFGVQNNENELTSGVTEVDTMRKRIFGEFVDVELSIRFDLKLDVFQVGNSLVLEWFFDESLFIDATIERMTTSFSELLEVILQQSIARNQPIQQIEFLSRFEKSALLDKWNKSSAYRYPGHLWFEWFEAHVIKSPDSIAVIKDSDEVTYHELNKKANQLANMLLSRGIKTDQLIGICLERSIDMLIALLAINKAGAGYVPLDPNSPEERLSFILQDSDCKLVLTQESIAGNQLNLVENKLCIDNDAFIKTLANYDIKNIDRSKSNLHESNVAYVIYTSGSTGVPKGVVTTHRNLSEFLSAAGDNFINTEISGAIVSSTLVFDATVGSLLVPLCFGLYAEILDDGIIAIEQLSDCLSDDESSYLFKITPSHIEAVISKGFIQKNVTSKHVLVIAGEALASNLIFEGIKDLLPNSLLINEYGPTETTVGSTTFNISDIDKTPHLNTIPIGQSLGCTDLYVLNQHQQIMPIGGTGELYIGGEGIARGYLRRPSLTAEKFLPNPFSLVPGERLYRTGDLVKYLSDTENYAGNITFVGRVDHQVKIRGYRIELDEIQKHLEETSLIKNAVVVARQRKDIGVSLIAYIVVQDVQNTSTLNNDVALVGGNELAERLKNILRNKLPEYMVPSSYMVIKEMPLTLNGKIDISALPDVDVNSLNHRKFKEPTSKTEISMCQMWQSLLGLNQVGVLDNFFDLGGHSLLATRLISLVREEFQVEISLRALFENPSVESFSTCIDDCLLDQAMLKNKQDLSGTDDAEEVVLE
ncbi:amino acid adenylation domain-containing protein [Aliikangiella marina]|uniref:Amino acid adenylation domain-containing protein n=1 Tax=Aliikangiella marina TaxID=1712262 RepID=A0A545TJJ7_9GAMM|nr:non-ribosomal peptide synthetase [Aliikangiella marina]TQV77377.1 amino acid adenylation domain-containing protein [Aliikangiella marina]